MLHKLHRVDRMMANRIAGSCLEMYNQSHHLLQNHPILSIFVRKKEMKLCNSWLRRISKRIVYQYKSARFGHHFRWTQLQLVLAPLFHASKSPIRPQYYLLADDHKWCRQLNRPIHSHYRAFDLLLHISPQILMQKEWFCSAPFNDWSMKTKSIWYGRMMKNKEKKFLFNTNGKFNICTMCVGNANEQKRYPTRKMDSSW